MEQVQIKYREIIIGYLREELIIRGYRNISLDEVTDSLGISKKTIYKHYKNKESIYSEIFKGELESAYNDLIILLQEKSPMAEKVSKLSKIIEKNLMLFNINTLQNLKKEFYGLWKEIALFRKERVFPLIDLLIDHSKKNGLIAEYPNELIIELFSTSLNLASERKHNFQSQTNYQLVYKSIFEILLNGILTKKGKKILAINKRMKNENN
jgi:AcrR family transcriptional regulator